MNARPEEIERLCDLWLARASDREGLPGVLGEVLAAASDLMGASGAAIVLQSGGYIASGDLKGPGNAELAEGNETISERADGTLVRRIRGTGAGRFVGLFRFQREKFENDRSLMATAAVMSAVERRVGEIVPTEERRFGEYELLALLAEGGMAQIHLARRLEGAEAEIVALKRIRRHLAEDPGFLALFFEEMRTATRLEHPNVVRILEFGIERNQPYMAMEHLRGAPLSEITRRALTHGVAVGPSTVLAVALHFCAGLQAVHEKGIVHCDVSPQNLFLTFDGVGKVIDFGVARARGSRRFDGTVRGKLGYLAPEQVAHEPFDQRADLYALAVVTSELLLGGRTASPLETVRRYTRGEVPDLQSLDPTLPPHLCRAVMGALGSAPDSRHPTARDFADALETAAAADGIPVAPASQIAALLRDVLGDQDALLKRLLSRGGPAGTPESKTFRLE